MLTIVASLSGKTDLVPTNKEDYAKMVAWMSYANSEVFPAMLKVCGHYFSPAYQATYNKKAAEAAIPELTKVLSIVEERLAKHTYLVGERVTLADLYITGQMFRGFSHFFGKEWRKNHPGISRLWATVSQQDILKEQLGNIKLLDEPEKYVPPKKEAPKKEAKKEEPKKEEPPKEQQKKPAHPLAALGNAKMPLDAWKRMYSNEETREKALPWFWEQYDPEEWSLWRVDYKYNDELTLTFMSNNLVGGFFNRLTASTKYMFGCAVVYGENNNNGIVGAFLVRGQDHVPAFDVAPDWESYEFTKLDASKPEDKDFVENMWAWDKPVVINGESKEIADGKVFK